MNRGFCYYFKEGVRSSCTALFRNKHFFRNLVYFFMELIGRVTLFFGPLFDLAGVRQGKVLRKQKQIAVSPCFREAGKAGNVWTYFITVCVEGLMFLAGLAVLALITGALGLLGYAISTISSDLDANLFVSIFAVPGLLLALVYLVVLPIIFTPTPWIVLNNEGITVGDALAACFRTMKQNGKLTVALNTLIPLLINLAVLGIGVGGAFLWSELLTGNELYSLVMIVWILVSAVGFAVVAPIFALTTRSANEHLFEDIVLDPVAANKRTNGINITRCRGQKFEISSIESNLTALFDETDSESQPVLEEIVKETPASPAVDLGSAMQTHPSKRKKAQPPEAEPIAEEPSEPLPEPEDAEEGTPEPPVFEETQPEAPDEPTELVEPIPEPTEPEEIAEPEEPPVAEAAPEVAEESETVAAPEEEALPTVTDILGEADGAEPEAQEEEFFEDIFGDLAEEPQAEPAAAEAAEETAEPAASEEAEREPQTESAPAPEKERKKTAASKLLSRLKKK